jgi:hypothetical protein
MIPVPTSMYVRPRARQAAVQDVDIELAENMKKIVFTHLSAQAENTRASLATPMRDQ